MVKLLRPIYNGHLIEMRKAAVKLGLITEEELAYTSDKKIIKLINDSNHLILMDGSDYVIVPEEIKKQLVWICR